MRRAQGWIVGLAVASLPGGLRAETAGCPETSRIVECPQAIVDQLLGQKVAAAAKSTETTGTASVLRDTLSSFFVGLGLGTVSKENGDLTLHVKPRFLNLGPENPFMARLVVHEAKVFGPLLQAHPESGRADFRASLEAAVEEWDDLEVRLTWSRESDRFGLASTVLDAAFRTAVASEQSTTVAFLQRLAKLRTEFGDAVATMTVGELREKDATAADEVQKLSLADARQLKADVLSLNRVFGGISFDELVRNQPQILVDGTWRRRADIVGPDEWSVKATWEVGFVNLNTLAESCDLSVATDAQRRLACIAGYTADPRRKANLESSSRIAFAAEYSETESYDFTSAALPTALHLRRAHKATASLGAGRYIFTRSAEPDATRVDVEVKYDDVSQDASRSDRLVATATLSRRIAMNPLTGAGGLASLSLVYANRPEYRAEVDKELSARVGLKWKWDGAKP